MLLRCLIFLTLLAAAVPAQRHTLGEVNADTEEGKFLQSALEEKDAAGRQRLMEEFLQKYPKHEAAGYVFTQLQPAYNKSGEHDKAIAAGTRLLELDPLDLEAAYQNLKASEGKKDATGVLTWSAKTSDIAKKVASAPKPENVDAAEHAKVVDYARQVDTYTEYSLYATALAEPAGERVFELTEALETRNPSSQYLPMLYNKYSVSANQLKNIDRALAMGERAYNRGHFDGDLLLLQVSHYIDGPGKDHAKALRYAEKLVDVMTGKPAPQGIDPAQWQTRMNQALGVGHWAKGIIYNSQRQYAKADESLRASLPLVQENAQLHSGALFNLGLANYKLAQTGKSKTRAGDAVRFFDQCAKVKGPYQGQAAKNAKVVRQEFGVL
jgi:tetratricopeptide (TPR) repeat protein